MIFTVTLVSLCVHMYSCYYMLTDPNLNKFLSYLSFFTFFMLFLVSSDNLIQFFIGWEGVGMCSYLLINF
jgi:NADH:ubiquinone oxidoreductase subunit 5 (subunit L)/multisubunit Na+/H+ antiporter MnhA subunit